jgi:hypothetical protein
MRNPRAKPSDEREERLGRVRKSHWRYWLEATSKEQNEDDNQHHPDEARWPIPIRVKAKVGQTAHQEQY